MVDEDQNQENIFKGFGEEASDDKKDNLKYIVPAVGVVIVLGLFIYLISTFMGGDPTTMAVADLSDEDEGKLAAVQANQELLEQVTIQNANVELGATVSDSATLSETSGNLIEDEVLEVDLTETTITNYLRAINKVIELREASSNKDLLNTASFVTDVKKYIDGLDDSRNLITPWQGIISCVYDGCDDSAYTNMIDAIAREDINNKDHGVIHAVIETYQYWDGKNTVLFSQSLTSTNDVILRTYNSLVIEKWNEMIICNGECSEFDDLLFELIGLIAS